MITFETIERFPDYKFASDGGFYSKKYGYWNRLKLSVNDKGYYNVTLVYSYGKSQTYEAHRILCEAFHGPKPDGLECRHIDGNKLNIKASNLCWGTKLENARDKILHGTMCTGECHGRAIIKLQQAKQIKYMLALDLSCAEISRILEVELHIVKDISCGRTWRST